MRYEEILAQQPPSTSAGDRLAARTFVGVIASAISDKESPLTPSQRNYLYKLRGKWEVRAAGKDESWNEYGCRPGRRRQPKIETSSKVDVTAYGTEEELDPLLRRVIEKFGTPQRTDDI